MTTLAKPVHGSEPLFPPFGDVPSRMHDTKLAARCLGVAENTLRMERTRKRWDLSWHKIGSKALYREADLMAFLDASRVNKLRQAIPRERLEMAASKEVVQ